MDKDKIDVTCYERAAETENQHLGGAREASGVNPSAGPAKALLKPNTGRARMLLPALRKDT